MGVVPMKNDGSDCAKCQWELKSREEKRQKIRRCSHLYTGLIYLLLGGLFPYLVKTNPIAAGIVGTMLCFLIAFETLYKKEETA